MLQLIKGEKTTKWLSRIRFAFLPVAMNAAEYSYFWCLEWNLHAVGRSAPAADALPGHC